MKEPDLVEKAFETFESLGSFRKSPKAELIEHQKGTDNKVKNRRRIASPQPIAVSSIFHQSIERMSSKRGQANKIALKK